MWHSLCIFHLQSLQLVASSEAGNSLPVLKIPSRSSDVLETDLSAEGGFNPSCSLFLENPLDLGLEEKEMRQIAARIWPQELQRLLGCVGWRDIVHAAERVGSGS